MLGHTKVEDHLELAELEDMEALLVLVGWIAFDEDERTRGPIENICRDAPGFFRKDLRGSAQARGFENIYCTSTEQGDDVDFGLSKPIFLQTGDLDLRSILHASCCAISSMSCVSGEVDRRARFGGVKARNHVAL